jgi:GR25 family glycosyltransferase involved in LPS biosynthesis
MILEHQPRTFVIALKNHPVSEKQLDDCLVSAASHGWHVEVSWGVDGRTITSDTWETEGLIPRLDKPTMAKPGVQGCFLSHWKLWNLCVELNEPIVILEHDSVIQQKWESITLDTSIIKLHRHYSGKKVKYDVDSGNWSKSGHAYCISPFHAKILIEFVRRVGAYEVDIIMGNKVIPVQHLAPSWVERQNTYSTTENLI